MTRHDTAVLAASGFAGLRGAWSGKARQARFIQVSCGYVGSRHVGCGQLQCGKVLLF